MLCVLQFSNSCPNLSTKCPLDISANVPQTSSAYPKLELETPSPKCALLPGFLTWVWTLSFPYFLSQNLSLQPLPSHLLPPPCLISSNGGDWWFSCRVVVHSCNPVNQVAHQGPLSMRFHRQENWRGLPFPSPGDLLDPGIKSQSPALQAETLLLSYWGSPISSNNYSQYWMGTLA